MTSKRQRGPIDTEVVAAIEARAAAVKVAAKTDDIVFVLLNQTHRSDVINIENCGFSDADCARCALYIGYGSNDRPYLTSVRLQLSAALTGLHHFFPALSHSVSRLRKLDLSKNRLRSADMSSLCDALQVESNQCLALLVLSENPIADGGFGSLLARLDNNSSLRALICERCEIGCEGAAIAARFLTRRPAPVQNADAASGKFLLSLNRNLIGSRGLRALRVPLGDHISLTVTRQNIKPIKPID